MMNDNEPPGNELANILYSFCPDAITTLQRLKLLQELMLPIKNALCAALFVTTVFLFCFWNTWSRGEADLYLYAILITLFQYLVIRGYRDLYDIEQAVGHWKIAKKSNADRVFLNTGWVFVPSDAVNGKH